MLRWLWEKAKPRKGLVGLDLGVSYLKLLEINGNATSPKIENFVIKALPPGTLVKNEIKDFDLVSDILKSSFKEAGIKTKNIALAIPRSSTIIKTIYVDSRLNDEEIENRAWIEANQHFPDLIGDIYLDFSIMGVSSQDPHQLELMLVACRKEIIKPYIDITKNAGLDLKIVDINSYALERALSVIAPLNQEKQTLGLFNFDVNLTTLIVVQDKKLIYAHDETFAGEQILTQLREAGDDSIKQNNILKENLAAYLRHAMHFFYSSRPNVNIEKIYLSGDCALDSLLLPFIQKEIEIPMEIAKPAENMKKNSAVNELEISKYSPSLVLCTGLALSALQ